MIGCLKKDKDLVRYNGRDVDIQLFKPVNGSKQFTGVLQGFTDTSIDFTINGESITFDVLLLHKFDYILIFNIWRHTSESRINSSGNGTYKAKKVLLLRYF